MFKDVDVSSEKPAGVRKDIIRQDSLEVYLSVLTDSFFVRTTCVFLVFESHIITYLLI